MIPTIPERWTLKNLRVALQNPGKLKLKLDEMGKQIYKIPYNAYSRNKLRGGISVIDEDWDNLIILDACRYDIFKEYNQLEGDLKPVVSKGSQSKEFFEKNFQQNKFYDTIYITANPYAAVLGKNLFYKMKTTFEGNENIDRKKEMVNKTTTHDGRSLHQNHIENIDPEKITKSAIEEHVENPNKKLIIHYMQPHAPYIGEKARDLRQSLESNHDMRSKYFNYSSGSDYEEYGTLMGLAKSGYISNNMLRELYIENLREVLNEVKILDENLNGKSVVTSDHGELLGESNTPWKYGHPKNVFMKELRKVPWLSMEADNRRKIIRDNPVQEKEFSDQDIQNQLKLLGYK